MRKIMFVVSLDMKVRNVVNIFSNGIMNMTVQPVVALMMVLLMDIVV